MIPLNPHQLLSVECTEVWNEAPQTSCAAEHFRENVLERSITCCPVQREAQQGQSEKDIYSHEGIHVRATERPSVLEALMEPSHGWHVWSAAGYEKPVGTGENKF